MKYVGARYMPKFLGTYDATKDYEALSVVDNGMGTSYVSNKPVPAGTPLTNLVYWAVYGTTSGAITNLQNQIDALKSIGNKPEDYGAIGDGVTDDSTAVQTCVNNSKIVLLTATYLINTPITVPDGVIILGLNGTIKTDTRDFIITLSGNNIIDNVKFSDTLAYDASSGSLIYAIDADNISVTNCEFENVGNGHCIEFEHSTHITIEHNSIKNYGHSGIMLLDSCKYASIQFNQLYNSRYRGSEHNYPIGFSGYILTEHGPAQFIKVNYNDIEELTPFWEGIDSHGAKDYEIIGNKIKGTRCGVMMGSNPTSIATVFTDANRNCVIKDNDIDVGSSDSSVVPYGITISEEDATCIAENVIIENNKVKVSAANTATTAICSAISIRGGGGSKNVSIRNNILDIANRNGIGLDYGVHDSVMIDHNYVENMTTTSPYYAFVELSTIQHYDNIIIKNNVMKEHFTGNLLFFHGPGTAPDSNKLIEISDNDDKGMNNSSSLYSTLPAAAIASATSAIGVSGQFKGCTASGTVAGWYCKEPGSWLEISGTAI